MEVTLPAAPERFASAIDLLLAEVEAAVARCRRFGVQRKVAEDHSHDRRRVGLVGEVEPTATEEERRVLHVARAVEDAARARLEGRLRVTREQRGLIGLDALCEHHGLDDHDRAVLVLAAIPTISREIASCLDGISSHGYGCDHVTVEAVSNYLDLDLAERIEFPRRLRAAAPLVRGGLVTLDVGYTCAPQDWPEAVVKLTGKAWAAMAGVQVGDGDHAETCPACGREVAS